MGRLRQLARALFRVEDSPHRVALAFSIGIFIAFFPIIGIHTAMALGVAFLLRLNRVAILAGTFVNNPWTIAPMLMAGTGVGCLLLGISPVGLGEIEWGLHGRAFYRALFDQLRPFLLPYLLGNLVMGLAVSSVSYLVLRALLEKRRPVSDVANG